MIPSVRYPQKEAKELKVRNEVKSQIEPIDSCPLMDKEIQVFNRVGGLRNNKPRALLSPAWMNTVSILA